MLSVKSSPRIDINSDSIVSALHKKTNNHSLSKKTLHKLVKITSSTTELSKHEARQIFLKDSRIGPTERSAELVEDLNMMLPWMASPALKKQLEKFIYNCSGTTSTSKETAAEKNKTLPSEKHYSGYEEEISQELKKIPAMDVSELVELVKKRDELFIRMRELSVQVCKVTCRDEKLEDEYYAMLRKVNKYESVIRNQELIYEATHGKGINFSEMHIPPRRGEHCKLVALSLLENYFTYRMDKYYVPMLKEHHCNVSLRQLAKDEGSLQGEVLDSTMLKKLAEKIGYSVEMVRPESLEAFKECLQNNIQDKGIIIFYAIESDDLYDIYDDRFFYTSDSVEVFEHASVISWYDSEREICTLNHWQEKYPGIPVELLYKSNQSLKETRNKELYSIPVEGRHLYKDYTNEKGKRLYKYRVEHYRQHWDEKKGQHIDNLETGSPAPGTGFKGLVMLIEPDKNHCRWDPQQQYVLRRHGKNQTEWIPARKYSF